MALFQGIQIGMGFKKQSALQTALVAADIWTLRSTNQDVPQPVLNNESDKDDLGKGVYATQVYKSHQDSSYPRNGLLTSEWGVMLTAFGLGATVKTAAGTGGFKYTSVAPNLSLTDLEMPSTTMVVKIPDGSGSGYLTDSALVGMCCEEFGFQLTSGVGRQNAQFTSQWVGSGKYVKPSTITIPAAYGEHSLNSGGITTLTMIGINYLTSNRFISFSFTWKNNIRLDSGYFPGSGSQSGYQLRGRMRRGVPTITCSAVAEAVSGSAEEDALLNQTEGTLVMLLSGAAVSGGGANHSLKITGHRVVAKAAPIGQNDNIVTYNMELEFLEHATNGVLTTEAICEKDNILAAAA